MPRLLYLKTSFPVMMVSEKIISSVYLIVVYLLKMLLPDFSVALECSLMNQSLIICSVT